MKINNASLINTNNNSAQIKSGQINDIAYDQIKNSNERLQNSYVNNSRNWQMQGNNTSDNYKKFTNNRVDDNN